ncbi:MAG: 5'/3'-nucleotidase SurE [Nitrososphaerota archaeon]
MKILISNDDGIYSPGLQILAERLQVLGEVLVVAPDRERSAAGHSLTLNRPLRSVQIREGWYSVDGTPTDCITLAVEGILKKKPDLVVSGINLGANLGDDVTYSGTVSAAFEATLLGIPAFAISLAGEENGHLETAADFSIILADLILKQGLFPDTLLNVNVPNLPWSKIKGVAITTQGRRTYAETIVEKVDPRGRVDYWIGGQDPAWRPIADSDYEAVMQGWISITPLHVNLTNYAAMDELKTWSFPLPSRKG